MLSLALDTAIGRVSVVTDWPALICWLKRRHHPNPPHEDREVRVDVLLSTQEASLAMWEAGDKSAEGQPRVVRLQDCTFLISRDRIQGLIPRDSAHKGACLEWLWYALAVCCAPDGWEAFHAAAVVSDGQATLFAERPKTTAARIALDGGAAFLSDDVVLINDTNRVRGWDTSFHVEPGFGAGVDGVVDCSGKVRIQPARLAESQEYPIGAVHGVLGHHVGDGFDEHIPTWRPRRTSKALRVALVNRDWQQGALAWYGGDIVHMHGYAKGLRGLGVRAMVRSTTWADYDECDIVHVFHAQYPWAQQAARRAAEAGKPVVISAITHGHPSREELAPAVECATRVLCYSEQERAFYIDRFTERPQIFVVVPLGVHQALLGDHPTQAERAVLCAGSYNAEKGRLEVLRACMLLDVPVSFAGPSDKADSAPYLARLRAEAGDWRKARFYGNLPAELLHKLYRRYWVHVDAAGFGPYGLCTLEALAAGCNIVHTQYGWATEEFGRVGTLCDPKSGKSIADAIAQELSRERGWHGYRPLSWDDASEELLKVYEGVLL